MLGASWLVLSLAAVAVQSEGQFGNCSSVNRPSFRQASTIGRSVLFTTGSGAPLGFTCRQLSVRDNATCQDFVQPVADAIGSVLLGLEQVGHECSAGEDLYKRNLEQTQTLVSKIGRLLAGQSFTSVSSSPVRGLRNRDQEQTSDVVVTIGGIQHEGGQSRIELHHFDNGNGYVSVCPETDVHRRAAQNTSSSTGSSGPGFKITYQSFPQHLMSQPLSPSIASFLGSQMAQEWADIATQDQNASRFFGVYAQHFQPILALQIIPEIRGFGNNPEDPNEPCGDLQRYACDEGSGSEPCQALLGGSGQTGCSANESALVTTVSVTNSTLLAGDTGTGSILASLTITAETASGVNNVSGTMGTETTLPGDADVPDSESHIADHDISPSYRPPVYTASGSGGLNMTSNGRPSVTFEAGVAMVTF